MSKHRIGARGYRGRVVRSCLGCALVAAALPAARLDLDRLGRTRTSSPLTEEQQIVHALNRICYGPRQGDVERVKSMELAAFIRSQLNPDRIEDSALEGRLAGLKTLRMRPADIVEAERAGRMKTEAGDGAPAVTRQNVAIELQQAKLLRAVYSERQLLEVMTDFWFNHFNVFIGKGADRILIGSYEREVIARAPWEDSRTC